MNNKDLIKQYVGTGQRLPYSQFVQIEKYPNLLKSYLRARNLAREEIPLKYWEKDAKGKLEMTELTLAYDESKLAETYNFEGLHNLVTLDINDSKLEKLSPSIGNLKNLLELNAADNDLKHLPKEFSKLQNLSQLRLNDNLFRYFPEEILHLEGLEYLSLSFNEIHEIPNEISNLKNLKQLELYRCSFIELPNSIGDLKSLKILNFGGNHILELPENFYNLRLEKLVLTGNRIRTLLPNIRKMTTLKELHIGKTNISDEEIEEIERLLPHCYIGF